MFLVHLHEYEAIEELLDDFALTIENCSQRIRPGTKAISMKSHAYLYCVLTFLVTIALSFRRLSSQQCVSVLLT